MGTCVHPRILVWGGSGFIGSHLVARLRERFEVSVMTRDRDCAAQLTSRGVPALIGNPSDFTTEELAASLARFDVIYDLAGSSGAVASNDSPIESVRSQCVEHLHMLRAAEVAGHTPHMIFASSRLVYGAPATLPVPEGNAVFPASLYAVHKHTVEQYFRIFSQKNAVTYTICRISNPYGFDGRATAKSYGFINALVHRGVRGEPLTVFGEGSQLRDYIHVTDLSRALELCAVAPGAQNAVLNIGSGVGVSIREAAESIAHLTGTQVIYTPWPREWSAVESGDYVSDIARARHLLGFHPGLSFADGLREVVTQYKEEGRLRAGAASAAGSSYNGGTYSGVSNMLIKKVEACS